jgi:3-oxoacyl-[acyl-carrier-protein] synthase-3
VHADGEYRGMLYCTGGIGGGRAPGNLPPGDVIRMAGNEIFKLAVNRLGQVVDEALAANGLKQDALDWLVPHQANIRIIRATARKLDLPMARVIVTIEDHGNTSSASVPLALDVGVRDGRIRRGELLLLEAFGGGITWGAALVRY